MIFNQVIPVHYDKAEETVVLECLITKQHSHYTLDFQCCSKGQAKKCCSSCNSDTIENLEFQALFNMVYNKDTA